MSSGRGPSPGFNGSTGYVSSPGPISNPTVFTIETWFKTTTAGGRLIGFGNAKTGASSTDDRHIYLTGTGRLAFGVQPGAKTVTSSDAYNDGAWHLATATLSSAGMALYVDGAPVAADASTSAAQAYNGYWRLGYDNLSGWPSQPGNFYYAGALAYAAVYPTALTASQIAAHYIAGAP